MPGKCLGTSLSQHPISRFTAQPRMFLGDLHMADPTVWAATVHFSAMNSTADARQIRNAGASSTLLRGPLPKAQGNMTSTVKQLIFQTGQYRRYLHSKGFLDCMTPGMANMCQYAESRLTGECFGIAPFPGEELRQLPAGSCGG